MSKDTVNHPSHYNTGRFEVIEVIEDWRLSFHLGNTIKYIARADHKGKPVEDLQKARWYLDREIELRSMAAVQSDIVAMIQQNLPFVHPGLYSFEALMKQIGAKPKNSEEVSKAGKALQKAGGDVGHGRRLIFVRKARKRYYRIQGPAGDIPF